MNRRVLCAWLPAALILGSGCMLDTQAKKEARQAATVAHQHRLQDEGAPAIPTQGVDADGAPCGLDQHAGKVVLLSFWHSRCPPCRAMFAHEKQLVARHSASLFALLGVNADPDVMMLRKTREKAGLSWNSIYDGASGPIAAAWRIEAFPTLVLIDTRGKIRWRHVGIPENEVLDRKIMQLIGEMQLTAR